MEEIPDNEDTEPRQKPLPVTGSDRWRSYQAAAFPFLVEVSLEALIIVFLLVLALVFSALRAAYSATAAFETPWEKKKGGLSPPERSQRFMLLILQRVFMLSAFLILANLLVRDMQLTDNGWQYFVGITLVWLLADAYTRLYAGRNAVGITHKTVPFIKPVLSVLNPAGNALLRAGTALGVMLPEKVSEPGEMTAEEIDRQDEKELLIGVASIGQTMVRQAMVSRPHVTGFDIRMDFHELMDKINKSGFSRIPVYVEDLDVVEGILYVKDLLPHIQRDEHFAWQKLIRKAYLVPETKRLDDLLNEFQQRRVHMAIVVDEYGGTSGLITMEDIIEEIFGDINDEYDAIGKGNYVKVDDGTYIFEGQSLLNDVIRTLNLPADYFDEKRRGSETLAGLVLELFARFPEVGEEVAFQELLFKVHAANKKLIKKIRIVRVEEK